MQSNPNERLQGNRGPIFSMGRDGGGPLSDRRLYRSLTALTVSRCVWDLDLVVAGVESCWRLELAAVAISVESDGHQIDARG